jgi:uncharacterized GH25 family protein
MNRFLTAALFTFGLAAVLPAQAHRAWILPEATVLSGENPWVTFDAAISNDIFYTDYYPMSLAEITAVGPNGAPVPLENANTGRFRSTFDLQLPQDGTYKLTGLSSGLYAFWKENGEEKGWRGSAADFVKQVPTDAQDLKVTEFLRRIETFVTAGAPTKDVFKPAAQGLSLIPETHPNDLYVGEPATFALMIDGTPAANTKVEIIPEGTRYRNRQGVLELTTDEQGKVTINWPEAGRYLLETTYEDDKAEREGAKRSAVYMATFEVLPL